MLRDFAVTPSPYPFHHHHQQNNNLHWLSSFYASGISLSTSAMLSVTVPSYNYHVNSEVGTLIISTYTSDTLAERGLVTHTQPGSSRAQIWTLGVIRNSLTSDLNLFFFFFFNFVGYLIILMYAIQLGCYWVHVTFYIQVNCNFKK